MTTILKRSNAIETLKAAILRTQEAIEDLEWEVRDTCLCCQDSALGGVGSPHDKLKEKRKRQLDWLCVLLKRRGSEKDLSKMKSIEWGCWP